MRAAPLAPLVALPLPPGEPAGLWNAAAVLRAAAATIGATAVARGVGRPEEWWGEAARAAADELQSAAALGSAAADRLVRAAAVLGEYADELDAAQRAVATLQASWGAALPADPLAVLPESTLSHVAAQHGVVTADLQLAAEVAAHRLRALVGEVLDAGAPGRRAPPALGWADPQPSEAVVRAGVLDALPVAAGAIRRPGAASLADDLVRDLAAVAAGDVGAIRGALVRLGARGRDPVVAQMLWSRLDLRLVGQGLDALARCGDGSGSDELASALGTALATAADPHYAAGLDPGSRAALDAWREPWLGELAASVVAGGVAAAGVQALLLTAARSAGLRPGRRYAETVGAAMVSADRALRSPSASRPAAAVTGGPAPSDDPVLAMAHAVDGDDEAVRAWLLAPLPGQPRELVVDHLVGGRYRTLDASAAAASFATTARLVRVAGADVTNRAAVALDAAFLQAVGTEARSAGRPAAYRVSSAAALPDVGVVLARHPDSLTAVLDDSSGSGVDARLVPDADRLTRPGRSPGTWDAVLADRTTAAALVGDIALDQPPVDDREPALAAVLRSVGDRLHDDLVTAVRADHAGDAHALEAASRRLGETVGFTLTSAGEGLAGRAADTDARNRMLVRLLETAVDKVALPGAGRAATPLVRAVADRVIAASLPTDAEAVQRVATRERLDAAAEATFVEVRAVVSRAKPWTAERSPPRWAADHGAVRFWDDAGAPLSEATMTTEQRRAFTAWRRDVGLAVYDSAPRLVDDGIAHGVDAGIRAAQR